jgi:transposase-like protein
MHGPDERSELIRAVTKRGEAVPVAAARLGVAVSTAYRWMRIAAAVTTPAPSPTFVEVVPERIGVARSAIVVRVGVAEIEVRTGFDARLLREVAEALGEDA